MLIEAILLRGQENPVITGIASMVFMAGWICSNIGMQRMRAAGTGAGGRAILVIQLIGVALACAFGFIEATSLLDETNIIFNVTNIAWPLSMLFMIVVGIAVLRAKRLRGWHRWVPLLCGLAFPVSIPVLALGGDEQGGLLFFTLLAVFWLLLGYVVRSEETAVAVLPAGSVA
jgi:hypothetical protein